MRTVFLCTSTWPNLAYMSQLLAGEEAVIEQHETFGKGSYKNRYDILTANGPLLLTVPVTRRNRTVSANARISYAEAWQIRHWRAIVSAYRKSPYFEHFEDSIGPFFTQRTDSLIEYNLNQLNVLMKIIRRSIPLRLTDEFSHEVKGEDCRGLVHMDRMEHAPDLKPYYQTFSHRHGFVANLSILDLLFNGGPTGILEICGLSAQAGK